MIVVINDIFTTYKKIDIEVRTNNNTTSLNPKLLGLAMDPQQIS